MYLGVALVLASVLALGWTIDLDSYQTCCHYCRGDQDLWMDAEPSWALEVQGDHITDFRDPAAFLVAHEITHTITLYNRDYQIRYGGIPVSVAMSGLTNPSAVLAGQYVQVDLGFAKDVAGVSVQGGFFEELENDLVERHSFTVTEFAVSTAMSATSFNWIRDPSGAVSRFSGPSAYDDEVLAGFHGGKVRARYLRLHPLGGRNHRGLDVQNLMLRLSVVYCASDVFPDTCPDSRSDCVLREWQNWGACTCDWAGCIETRQRVVARHQACGGTPCDGTRETRTCVPPEPLWKTIALAVGLGVLGLIILIIISWLIYKRFKANQPQFVFKKDEKRAKKEKKERKLRPDLAGDGKFEEEKVDDTLEDEDFAERELTAKKDLRELEKGTVVTADDQPAVGRQAKKEEKAAKKEAKAKQADARSQSSMDKLMNELAPENETEIEGLYMVRRDEKVAAAQPARPQPVGLAPIEPTRQRKDSLDELASSVLDEW